LSHLDVGLGSELVDTVTTVQRATDLFVSLHKALQLDSQVTVLSNQHVAVVLQSIDL